MELEYYCLPSRNVAPAALVPEKRLIAPTARIFSSNGAALASYIVHVDGAHSRWPLS
jgi:hypothetical protein